MAKAKGKKKAAKKTTGKATKKARTGSSAQAKAKSKAKGKAKKKRAKSTPSPTAKRKLSARAPERASDAKSAPAGRAQPAPSGSGPKPVLSTGTLGGLKHEDAPSPIEGAAWHLALSEGDGLEYRFPAGTLAGSKFLTSDMLLEGKQISVFTLTLQEGDGGPRFGLSFALLAQCSARMRVDLSAVDQNRWRFEREGAWLKPLCYGDPVDLDRVDRMTLAVSRKGDGRVRWCMTEVMAVGDEPPKLEHPVLPKGYLLDDLGQCATHEWPGRSRSALEVTARLENQLASIETQEWPDGWSQWGGFSEKTFDATGFFRTHHDGTRWWLVDPEGCVFWSAGIDCVRPGIDAAFVGLEDALRWLPPRGEDEEYDEAYGHSRGSRPQTLSYLKANFIRAFGSEEWYSAWARITLSLLRSAGFNTVANWSNWEIARAAGFPYVRPLDLGAIGDVPSVFRDFPDVFSPEFDAAAVAYAQQLADTADDPALIGYFLMNEPTWGFAGSSPACGMLRNGRDSHSRRELANFLRERYGRDNVLCASWGITTSFSEIASGEWTARLTAAAEADLAAFSEVMVTKLFKTLSETCKEVDPNHLNLGARYYTVPPEWAIQGMKHFDVFSMNCYRERVPADEFVRISQLLDVPVIVGEWHFGAHDVGLPASGIGRVESQAARGAAFRFYTEDAAARPECVGVHYFTFYDQSAIGRFDGECYNIGFVDVCNRPYDELMAAAREAHERLYPIALGRTPPTDQRPEYLSKLFV